MQTTELLTSKEAVKIFIDAGLSESLFRRKVREKVIQAELPEGRQRGAYYSRAQVMAFVDQEKPVRKAAESHEESGTTDWVKESDLPYLLAIDLELYGIENTVDISITHAWWKKNPNACLILYNSEDRREIWGGITIMPMKEETIFKLLRDEMQERQITPDDILVYEPGGKYCGYIASAVIRPEHRKSFIKLIHAFLNFFCEKYPDIQVTKLYGFAASDEGYDLIKKLFFAPRYDIGDNAFELDPYRRNPSKLIQTFQECIRGKEQQVAS